MDGIYQGSEHHGRDRDACRAGFVDAPERTFCMSAEDKAGSVPNVGELSREAEKQDAGCSEEHGCNEHRGHLLQVLGQDCNNVASRRLN
jgi:hypothetical protein